MSGLALRTNIITLGAFRKRLMRYRSKKWFRGALQNLEKSVGQHLCQSFFFKKIAGLQPTPLLKKKFSFHKFYDIFQNRFLCKIHLGYCFDLEIKSVQPFMLLFQIKS